VFAPFTNGDCAEADRSGTKKNWIAADIPGARKIHLTGAYKVQVKLHHDVIAEINL